MNWKFMAAATFGLLAGLSVAPFAHRTVAAAPASAAPANAHFEIRDATVDEEDNMGQDAPFHEVFLLDTQSGQVWTYQGTQWVRDKDGKEKIVAFPHFNPVPVDVAPAKAQ